MLNRCFLVRYRLSEPYKPPILYEKSIKELIREALTELYLGGVIDPDRMTAGQMMYLVENWIKRKYGPKAYGLHFERGTFTSAFYMWKKEELPKLREQREKIVKAAQEYQEQKKSEQTTQHMDQTIEQSTDAVSQTQQMQQTVQIHSPQIVFATATEPKTPIKSDLEVAEQVLDFLARLGADEEELRSGQIRVTKAESKGIYVRRNINIDIRVLFLYWMAVVKGYTGSLSDFINEVVLTYFAEKGILPGIVYTRPEAESTLTSIGSTETGEGAEEGTRRRRRRKATE